MKKEKFKLFFGGPFSQWYPCKIEDEEIEYSCAEQYMMHKKALLFKDEETAEEIMKAQLPAKQKKLGRKVKNFDQEVWDKNKKDIVWQVNFDKFMQNKDLKRRLLDTKGTTLVEASPYDKIWGIGRDSWDPRARDRNEWLGQNLLGQILTEVRDALIENE